MKLSLLAFTVCLSCRLLAGELMVVRLPDGAMQPRVTTVGDGSHAVVFCQGSPRASEVKLATLSGAGALGPLSTLSTSGTRAVAMGTVRGPSLALGADGARHVVWHGMQGSAADGKGSALWFVRVDAAGKASAPANLIGKTRALDGGAAIAAEAAGHVWIVWHALPEGKDGEAERRVFVRKSSDNGLTFSKPWPVKGEDMGICGCCGLAATVDASGSLHILYRVAENKSQRGARLIRLPADATARTAAELVHKDRWSMPGCPMTTAALVPDGNSILSAWITEYQVQLRGWTAPTEGGKVMQNHPRLIRNTAGETLLLWTEGAMWGKGGESVARTFDPKGDPTGSPLRQSLPLWSHAAGAALADGRFAVIY
jgi:hypothetical protein